MRCVWSSACLLLALTSEAASAENALCSLAGLSDPDAVGVVTGLEELLAARSDDRPDWIISFADSLSLDQHRLLAENGVELSCYLGCSTYVAYVPSSLGDDARRGFPDFRFARGLTVEEKLASELRPRGEIPKWAREKNGEVRVLVEVFHSAKQARSPELFRLAARYYARDVWRLVATPETARGLARFGFVRRVQLGPLPFLPLNGEGRRVVGTDNVQLGGGEAPDYGSSGIGIRLGICDGGVYGCQLDFLTLEGQSTTCSSEESVADCGESWQQTPFPSGLTRQSRLYGTARNTDVHGTLVASVAGGCGLGSGWGYDLRGHAPNACIGTYKKFHSDYGLFRDALYCDATDVTNHSYVQSCSAYDAVATGLDRLIHGGESFNDSEIPRRPQVWAAGNNRFSADNCDQVGYFSVHTSAKNTISVGSIDAETRRLSRKTALGPTLDGRIKPDLVAPGARDSWSESSIQGIRGAHGALVWGERSHYGTSFAAPVVTGLLGLMMEAIRDEDGDHHSLFPSTYRALLVNTALDLEKTERLDNDAVEPSGEPLLYGAGPDAATGYGLVQAEAAMKALEPKLRRQGTIASTGEEDVFCLEIRDTNTETLRVTVAWDDDAGCSSRPPEEPALVNDLDLELRHETAEEPVYPWKLTRAGGDAASDQVPAPGFVANRCRNDVDNLERVDVATPQTGVWTATVRGYDLPFPRTQDYSLVASVPISSCPPGVSKGKEAPSVCEALPAICEPGLREATRTDDEGRLVVQPGQYLAVDDLCHRMLDCPPCEVRPWELCEAWSLRLEHVPEGVRLVVLDDEYLSVLDDESGSTTRSVTVSRPPGVRYFVFLLDHEGRAWASQLNLGLGVGG